MKSGEYAAIKIMSKQGLESSDVDPEYATKIKAGIMREIIFMKVLHHPNILRLYDAFITRGNYYLILEYVDGEELFNVITNREGRIPLDEALGYFQQIVISLEYCHRFNIAHRDLKPENVLVCKNGVVKLADFGLAGWLANNGGMVATQCGSPHYLAPEVITGNGVVPYDGRAADVWSTGMILYTLLTGEIMFHSDDHNELFTIICRNEIKIPGDICSEAQDILRRMLERNPDRRYTIFDVRLHPFFELLPAPEIHDGPDFDDLAQPLREQDLDSKVIDNLRYLWPDASPKTLRTNLLRKEKTWEQATYHLLLQHRTRKEEDLVSRAKRAEEYQAQKKAERAQRKAMERMLRMASDRPTTPVNAADIPPRADPPTPRRASGSRSPEFADAERTPVLLSIHVDDIGPSPVSPNFPATPYSPRWEELDLPGIPDVNKLRELCRDPRWSEFFDAVEEHVASGKVLQPQGARQNVKTARRVSDRMKAPFRAKTRPLTINRGQKHKPPPLKLGQGHGLGLGDVPENEGGATASKENEAIADGGTISKRKSTLKKSGIENRRPHSADPRHVRINDEPTWHPFLASTGKGDLMRRKSETLLGRRKSTSSAVSDLSSPRSPATPTWFTGLFAKKLSHEFLSAHDEKATRSECERILAYMGVQVELTRHDALGMLKCRVDEHQDDLGTVIKAIRFRVVVQPATQVQAVGGFNSFASLELEKGAPATFRAFCTQLREVWDLDVPRLPAHEMSPALDTSFQLVDEYVDEIQY